MLNIAPVSPKVALDCLQVCHAAKSPLMLWGSPGIGKSSIVKQFAQANNLRLIDLRLTQMEPGDFAVPFVNTAERKLELFLTDRIPFDNIPTLIFFDELPNAENRVQVAIYQMILDRNLAGRPFPDNYYLMAAGNTVEDNCNVYEMSSALADRFTHLHVVPDVDEWLVWATANQIAPEICTFLKVKPEFFTSNQGQVVTDQMIVPTPRSWAECSKFFTQRGNRPLLKNLVAGRIGKAAATEFFGVLEELESLPPIEDLFNARTEADLLQLLGSVNKLAPLYGLAYSVTDYAKDLKTFTQTTKIFTVVAGIEDDLPRSEIQTLAQELISQKVTASEPAVYLAYLKSPEFAAYAAKHKSLTAISNA